MTSAVNLVSPAVEDSQKNGMKSPGRKEDILKKVLPPLVGQKFKKCHHFKSEI